MDGKLTIDSLGDPEIDHLDEGANVAVCHQDIGRFEIAMNDAFLVRVLDSIADGQKQT